MNRCVDPLELREGDLMAYLDGQESEKVRAHLARCPYCAAQVERYRRTTAVAKAALHRFSCPDPEQLGLYQLNLLPAQERLILARHIRECPHCARELEELAHVGERPSLLERLRQAAGIVEAVLLPAPRLQAMPLRGALSILQRFRAKEAGIDVHLSVQAGHSRGRRTLMGRLAPRDETSLPAPDIEVWLMRGEEAWAAPVEAGGVFTFEEVEPGEYSLGLEWHRQAVLVRGVEVA